ncbi:MAG: hypothetical protein H6R04_148 [Burkholderiaceae bacterium]|nr:hypothetical protein [Burkholderiaceae bacterium]
MKKRASYMFMQFLALLFAVSVAHAQPAPAPVAAYSTAELDQMLAPVALYPDGLLSQVLMASTYPSEVAEAAAWSSANPGYKGDAAVRAAEGYPWDISVKSLLPFPQLLNTMATNMDWTERLGLAFINQQQQVMDAIQRLRHRAMEAGYLMSDSRIKVVVKDQLVSIYPVKPTVVYVPYYNPTVVYGTWHEPTYAPVYWDPWPGYVSSNRGWVWAAGTIVGVGLLYGAFDWHRHHVREYHHHHYYDRHTNFRDRIRDGRTRTWVRDTHKPVIDRSTTRFTNTRFTGGRLTNTRTIKVEPPRPGTTRVAPGTTRVAPGTTRPGPATTRVAPGTTKPGVTRTGPGAPSTGAVPGTTRVAPGTTKPGVTRTGPGAPSTGAAPGVRRGPTGTPGSRSVSERGTNPPGEARGIRGTQPGQVQRQQVQRQQPQVQRPQPQVQRPQPQVQRQQPQRQPVQRTAPNDKKRD